MKIGLYYVAPNPNGTSAQIVKRLQEKLVFPVTPQNISDAAVSPSAVTSFDMVFFLTATYGDQELNDAVEEFVLRMDTDLSKVKYLVCEVGNYYGYDDYTFGSGMIIERFLDGRKAKRVMKTNSVDSLPRIDWKQVDAWIELLNQKIVAE